MFLRTLQSSCDLSVQKFLLEALNLFLVKLVLMMIHSGHVHMVQMYQALFSSSAKTLGSELDMCHTPATLVVCGLLASPVFARH